MRIARIVRCLLPATVAVLLGACAATGTEPIEAVNTTGSEMMKAEPPGAYRFHPGDELSITAINRPELTLTTRVDPYGYINYPYLGNVLVKDMTSSEVVERLTRGLQDGDYYKRVTLTYSTHSAGGLTGKDFEGAKRADQLALRMGGT